MRPVYWVARQNCNGVGAYKLTAKPGSKKAVREGVYKCKSCQEQFTLTVNTIFEDSYIPLNKWLLASGDSIRQMFDSSVARLVGGAWVVWQLNDLNLVADRRPYLLFPYSEWPDLNGFDPCTMMKADELQSCPFSRSSIPLFRSIRGLPSI